MAHKKGKGSTSNSKDSAGRRLGIKAFSGQIINAGTIIVRQKGNKYHPGKNVGQGNDFTLYAMTKGTVEFAYKKKDQKVVNIIPAQ